MLRGYGVAGTLSDLMEAVSEYNERRDKLERAGAYGIGYHLSEESRRVASAEAAFVVELLAALRTDEATGEEDG